MAEQTVSGSVVNTVGFELDKRSWSNLDKFQKRISQVKKQLNGLNTTVKINARVQEMSARKIEKSLDRAKRVAKKKDAGHPLLAMQPMLAKAAKEGFKEQATLTRLQDQVRKKHEKSQQRELVDAAKERNKILDRFSKEALAKEKQHLKERRDAITMGSRLRTAKGEMEGVIGKGRLGNGEVVLARKKWKALVRQWRQGHISSKQLMSDIKVLNRGLRQQSSAITTISQSMRKFRSSMIAMTGAYTAFSALLNVKETGKQFEAMGVMFNTVFGSKAKDEMAFLTAESERLGVNLLASAKGYAKIAFAAKEANVPLEQQRNIYTALAEASVVFGMTQDELAGTMKAVVDMFSKGTVSAEELKQQLGDRLVGAVPLTAKALNVTTEELFKLMKQGKLLAKDVLPKLANAIRDLAAPGLQKAMKNLAISEGRLANAFDRFKRSVMEGGVKDALVFINTVLTDILESSTGAASGFSGWIKQLATVASWLNIAVGFLRSIPGWIDGATASLREFLGLGDSKFLNFLGEARDIARGGPLSVAQTLFERSTRGSGAERSAAGENRRNMLKNMTTTPEQAARQRAAAPSTPTAGIPQQNIGVTIGLQPDAADVLTIAKQDPVAALAADTTE